MHKRYAIITKSRHLPVPFLVEISSRTRTTVRHLGFYEPFVVWCGRHISLILQEIQANSMMIRRYLDAIILLLSTKEVVFLSKSEAFSLCLNAIIKHEIDLRATNSGARTRSSSQHMQSLYLEVVFLRNKRVREEAHLQLSFKEDFVRTIAELNHSYQKMVASRQKVNTMKRQQSS
jgi:hypothetical protein